MGMPLSADLVFWVKTPLACTWGPLNSRNKALADAKAAVARARAPLTAGEGSTGTHQVKPDIRDAAHDSHHDTACIDEGTARPCDGITDTCQSTVASLIRGHRANFVERGFFEIGLCPR